MNYYDLENHMWERQRDTLRDADRRRMVAKAGSQPDARSRTGSGTGILVAVAAGLRSLLLPGRTGRIDHPKQLGDAS